jgi:hypothetical protein
MFMFNAENDDDSTDSDYVQTAKTKFLSQKTENFCPEWSGLQDHSEARGASRMNRLQNPIATGHYLASALALLCFVSALETTHIFVIVH